VVVSRTRASLIAAGSAVAAGALALAVSFAAAPAAAGVPNLAPAAPPGSMEVSLKQASLDDHSQDCPDGATSAHIVLNQIAAGPGSIQVKLSDGSTVTVFLAKFVGRVAHYDVPLSGGLSVTGATAFVPANWTGQFVLSHYVCGPPTTPPSSSSTPPSSSSVPPSSSSVPPSP